jgi:hypothetical protein
VKKLTRKRRRRQKNYSDSLQLTLFQIAALPEVTTQKQRIVKNTKIGKIVNSTDMLLFKGSHETLITSIDISIVSN